MRILMVEDERHLADTVRRGLVNEGFVVDVVHDGVRPAPVEPDEALKDPDPVRRGNWLAVVVDCDHSAGRRTAQGDPNPGQGMPLGIVQDIAKHLADAPGITADTDRCELRGDASPSCSGGGTAWPWTWTGPCSKNATPAPAEQRPAGPFSAAGWVRDVLSILSGALRHS